MSRSAVNIYWTFLHIGITAGILEGTDDETADAILKAMSEKNAPMLEKICEKDRLPQEKKQLLEQLIRLYEPIGTGIERLKNMELPKECREAVTELEELCDVLKLYGIDKNIYLDFSIICDTDYYNGIFFKGFIAGIARACFREADMTTLCAEWAKNPEP